MSAKYTKEQQADLEFYLARREELYQFRTNKNIEKIWRQADADYEPHELGAIGKKVLVENERTEVSTYVNLSKNNWRSRMSKNDPFIKIQTAISILFDRNPEAVFDPAASRYEAATKLIEQLYHRSWTNVNIGSKRELRKFIFNLAKYGWAPARRHYKRVVRKGMQAIKEYNLESGEFKYEKKDLVDVDDVFFESKNPFDVWIDDMARPDDPRSRRDWMWQEVYDKVSFESLLESFGSQFTVKDFVFSSVLGQEDEKAKNFQKYTSNDLIKVNFYENRLRDKYLIEAEDKLLSVAPLPRDDKELSLVDAIWTIRSTEDPFGIGINEIMRHNKVALDKVRNMAIDQVVLSVYKMFFYSNTEQLDDEGGETISLEPGRGKKVIDPKNITWFDVPGPGRDAYQMMEMFENDMDDDTGLNKTLSGEITSKTAFEISQAQQGALKRLAVPLRNIKSALEWDAKLTVNLMKMVYAVPKVYAILEPELITQYVANVEDDKERYFVDENGVFNALKYREFQLNLERNQDGIFEGAEKKQFFMVKPSWLDWDGEITIRSESIIEASKPLERENKLQMSNIIIPLMGQMAANPALVDVYMKPVKQVLKIYDENPKEWLPDAWLAGPQGFAMQFPGQPPQPGQASPGEIPAPETVMPSTELPQIGTETGLVQQQAQQLVP